MAQTVPPIPGQVITPADRHKPPGAMTDPWYAWFNALQLFISSGGVPAGAVSSVSTADPALSASPSTGAVVLGANDFTSLTHGTVPASGGGSTNFLRADGTWASAGSPLTTKGDVFGYDTGNNRIPVGANGTVLTADSTQALGVKWAAGGGGTPAALTPATIANLLHWSETDVIASASGGNVQYLDQRDPYRTPPDIYLRPHNTGNPAGPTVAGSTLNGLPVLSFPGTADGNMDFFIGSGLNLGSGAGSTTTIGNGTCSIFAVMNPNLAAGFSLLSGGNSALNIQVANTGQLFISSDGVVVIGSSSINLTPSVWQQFNITYSNATGVGAFRVARVGAGTFTNNVQHPGAVTSNAFFNQFSGLSSENYHGLFASLIIYGRVLSGAEITSVETYILNKWGV